MSRTSFESVDAYIDAQPESARNALRQVRAAIRKAVPRADESISYNMPAYKIGKVSLLQFAAWKEHLALYVASKPIVAAFKNELQNCEIDTGTIRFSLADPVPGTLIGRIAKFRADRMRTP